jgi:hypothetical protein
MGFFDRFTNPLWYEISRLDREKKFLYAVLLTTYPFCRHTVNDSFVEPCESWLKAEGHRFLTIPDFPGLTEIQREQLIDEALIALLRCSKYIRNNSGGRLTDLQVQSLPDVLGVLALNDAKTRGQAGLPDLLEKTSYSTEPDEARTQVLLKWMALLRVSDADFVRLATLRCFGEWRSTASSLLGGFLLAIARNSDDFLMSSAQRAAAALPHHQAALLRGLVRHALSTNS